MKIQFSRDHNLPHTRNNTSPYTNSRYTNSQLAICITGTKDMIAFKLRKMADEIENGEDHKPMQGVTVNERCVAEVITPIWDGLLFDSRNQLEFNEERQ
jgi:hypothetical protein